MLLWCACVTWWLNGAMRKATSISPATSSNHRQSPRSSKQLYPHRYSELHAEKKKQPSSHLQCHRHASVDHRKAHTAFERAVLRSQARRKAWTTEIPTAVTSERGFGHFHIVDTSMLSTFPFSVARYPIPFPCPNGTIESKDLISLDYSLAKRILPCIQSCVVVL